jgi:hypothetical protein
MALREFLGQHSITIICGECGNTGTTNWEYIVTLEGPEREFVAIVGSFYERLCNKKPYQIELVCGRCETPFREQAAPTLVMEAHIAPRSRNFLND